MAAKRSPAKGTIPFVEAKFFDSSETARVIKDRFKLHLGKLRGLTPIKNVADEDGPAYQSLPSHMLSQNDLMRIDRRANCILRKRQSTSPLIHLNSDDKARLEVLRDGVRLITIASEHRADELAAALHAEMPWMAPATEVVWHAMRRSVREGWPGLRLPPILLDGPPGIGKSHWGRRLGEVLGSPTTVIDATGENSSFGIVGSQRSWSHSKAGRPLETVLQTLVGNPVIVIDEVEKAGIAVSSKGLVFGLAQSLLPLLEPSTAQRWTCPYYQVKFDMTFVIWVLTANSTEALPAPLLSRCPPIRLRDLSLSELEGFVRREGVSRGLSFAAIDAIEAALALSSARAQQPSLRVAARMLQRAADLEQAPQLH